jgi:hypothetical protein
VVRKMQIMKLRGQASVPGLHTIRISNDGLQAFSRTLGLVSAKTKPARRRYLSIGIPELDKMLGGGILEGDSLLVRVPPGRANRRWRRNSSRKDCAKKNRELWQFSKNVRKDTSSGRALSVST